MYNFLIYFWYALFGVEITQPYRYYTCYESNIPNNEIEKVSSLNEYNALIHKYLRPCKNARVFYSKSLKEFVRQQ